MRLTEHTNTCLLHCKRKMLTNFQSEKQWNLIRFKTELNHCHGQWNKTLHRVANKENFESYDEVICLVDLSLMVRFWYGKSMRKVKQRNEWAIIWVMTSFDLMTDAIVWAMLTIFQEGIIGFLVLQRWKLISYTDCTLDMIVCNIAIM